MSQSRLYKMLLRYIALLLPLLLWSKPFKVATYNVENLFDSHFDGSEYKEYIPHRHNWTKRMVDIKLNHTAEVICDVDADILGLQEVENSRIFKKLIKRLKQVGCSYRYSAITHKKDATIQVALLSRYPIKKEHTITVSHSSKVRDILEVEVDVQGEDLTIFVNHWKSKAYNGYESKRIKYAKALMKRIWSLSKDKEYIILGDLNSDYNAYLSLEAKNNDTNGRTAFNDILQTKLEGHLVDKNTILKAKRGVHYSLWLELKAEDRWSHKFYGKKSSLDNIVLPHNMFDAKGIDYVNNSFKVFRAKYLFTKRGYINSWRYKNGKHLGKGYSDHLPIFAYFDTKAFISDITTKKSEDIKNFSIEKLYKIKSLDEPIVLKDVKVILKRGNSAIVKQHINGRGVLLFGCASMLHNGGHYDLQIDSIKSFYGLKEITTAYILKKYRDIDPRKYIFHLKDNLKQNEVVSNVVGIYRDKNFYTNGRVLPIYFKNRKNIPKNGSKLKIAYAHIGYYKQLQLVIYSKKDFKILE